MGVTFDLEDAPVVSKKTSGPIDLGQFDTNYTGWKVVIDLSTTLEVNDLVADASETDSNLKSRNDALKAWIAAMVIQWNFVDDEGKRLPQPRDGGAVMLRQELIAPISQAIGQALSPKKS